MERLYTDEDKSHVLQLFVNITDLVPQHIGQVIRLLKVNPYLIYIYLFVSNKRQNGKNGRKVGLWPEHFILTFYV